MYDPGSLRAAMEGSDIALNLATALSGGDFAANDRLRREGAAIWLQACSDVGVPRVLQQSIAFMNAGGTDEWTDETYVHPSAEGISATSGAAEQMEAAVRATALDWVILRGASFYGPGTKSDDGWFERAKAGTLRLPGDGNAFISLIHIADMASATVAAVERWPSREVFIVADDAPTRWSDLFGFVSAIVGAGAPEPGGPDRFRSMRLRNTKAREMLAWEPAYPDFRSGLVR